MTNEPAGFFRPMNEIPFGVIAAPAIAYSGIGTFILLNVIGRVTPLRASRADESTGLDLTHHGEETYLHGGGTSALG